MFNGILKTSSPQQKRLFFSISVGVATAIGVEMYIHSIEREQADRMTLVPVLVSPVYIPQGTRLHPRHFEAKMIPRQYVQPDCVSASDLLDEKGLELYENLLPLAAGEHLTASKLCRIGVSGGFSWLIREGYVALSVDLPPERSAAGLIEPGDAVDLLVTFEGSESSAAHSVTVMLFQNIKVLGVGDRLMGGRTLKKTSDGSKEGDVLKGPESGTAPITLMVKPYEAAVIAHVRQTASLRLALRPVGDLRISEIGAVDDSALLGREGKMMRENASRSTVERSSASKWPKMPQFPTAFGDKDRSQ